MSATKLSPFLHPGIYASTDSLAIIHLKRDHQIPTVLRERDDEDEGYAEGKVINTQFGSFPHTTLIGLPWGSQVRASKVDTGSRGRRAKAAALAAATGSLPPSIAAGDKRKRDDVDSIDSERAYETTEIRKKASVVASSGFVHLLDPTPENWTSSLPHRTQVVYTPDYSYILQKIRARPGSRLIEAGAGSGSFTHASARAVFNGYPQPDDHESKKRRVGKVWSYEFHEQRYEKLRVELRDHCLEDIVQITHRDVCQDGFLVGEGQDESPGATAIFLDLPAPWLALPHLSRRPQPAPSTPPITTYTENGTTATGPTQPEQQPQHQQQPFVSPLDPQSPVHICTFSPCIEQVQRTISSLRRLGWVDICMAEMAHKRLDVRRERVGIVDTAGQRGVQATPADVDEALGRLREVEGRFSAFHQGGGGGGSSSSSKKREDDDGGGSGGDDDDGGDEQLAAAPLAGTDATRATRRVRENPNSRAMIIDSLVNRKVYKEGRLVHRTEPEVKTHTSYLVFAVLPREWSAGDEAVACERWPVGLSKGGAAVVGDVRQQFAGGRPSNRQLKKAARAAQREKKISEEGEAREG